MTVFVMPLTKVGDAADQDEWMIVTWETDPRHSGINIGDVINIDDEPADFKWLVSDIFEDDSQ